MEIKFAALPIDWIEEQIGDNKEIFSERVKYSVVVAAYYKGKVNYVLMNKNYYKYSTTNDIEVCKKTCEYLNNKVSKVEYFPFAVTLVVK